MDKFINNYIEGFMGSVVSRNPGEKEFHQAVREVVESVAPFMMDYPNLMDQKILERIVEPERIIIFRVPWMDDRGEIQINRGFRVQASSAIGPYKGGIRFHPSVNLSIMKFLAFEQTFKNALTTLPMGGAKGGSDFNPRGKSDAEVMRFCQSFMTELFRHIGPNTDVPAGDIGVGGREIGFLFGQYKRLRDEFSGTLTGKGIAWGGSLLRPEATGYGLCYFTEQMLATRGESFEGKKVNIKYPQAQYFPGERPWRIPCDIALPCATQNEVEVADAENIVKGGAICLAEGANMPTTPEAIKIIQGAGLLYSPGKASNAGGVATSGLEMSQNSMRTSWTAEEVDQYLRRIMSDIHAACVKYGTREDGTVNYVKGANIAGFIKVAGAMADQGLV